MAFDADEDILQDFLVEAGEILELLSEQLVELENNPEDADLLNAIFRGFHTVKGGAGFLALTTLVDACHGAENVFDILRNGQRSVTPELMDVILQALDTINEMFALVKAREEPDPADPELLEALHRLSEPEGAESVAAPEPVAAPVEPEPSPIVSNEPEIFDLPGSSVEDGGSIDEITDDEFEALLDELHGSGRGPSVTSSVETTSTSAPTPSAPPSAISMDVGGSDEDITDDEFEALLDELHGKGQFGVAEANVAATPVETSPKPVQAPSSVSSDEITDDEFESLLDELHGKGKGPSVTDVVSDSKPKDKSSQPAKPVEPPKQAPVAPEPTPAAPKPVTSAPAPVKKPEPDKPKMADKKKPAPAAPAQETTVRVDTSRLDQIMNMVGELVLVRNRLVSLANEADERMSKAIANLDVVTGDLQGAVMKTRMQPIKKVFGRFPRVVRDLARSLNKEISLELEGEETDLDKNLVEALADPLVHLVRNSVDHGIEMPDDREAKGKPRCGIVKLSASQEGDHILLTITDDGAGMDAEKLKNIAINKGILDSDAAARLSDNEAYNLIFAPGFSTKQEISDISGRGVGMDVVKTKITQLNGSVNIHSELGTGTRLEIKVPLTLAILPTLMVVVAQQTFALPLAAVSEIINMDLSKTNTVDGQLTMIVREKAIPLFYLEKWLNRLGLPSGDTDGHVVVVQLGTDKQVGFVVDSLIGQEEVVIKPLDALLQGTAGMAGATITSDGGIALIIDIPSLLKHYAKRT
ncbi:chemotaxis protein CheA [Saccharobesus litoralis]|uniref:Chemotaxis protein CheA n=1 Tax=Saccharobesus litoralis TaxID=2172099 RepID=A0A2S0VT42_9ALTE|nr:chemotaxis protein CheA [Saccharobesus litoralis]AWB67388.1 chemotaxis protein CheA [Saccharobesus litoralis]